jgi:UDP-2,4-diacetamido-2,4,6-trideoxy-beta-L-altropyranose hydrolase
LGEKGSVAASPRVGIRVDSSTSIGAGHAMRCLTLAEFLRRAGAEIAFVAREGAGDLLDLVRARGFAVHGLTHPADDWRADITASLRALKSLAPLDWLVVDHYGLDHRWETRMRDVARRILVIDDLADRTHNCDALLDQNYYVTANRRYDGLVPGNCQLFLGPGYALLRDEFRTEVRNARRRDGKVERLLVSFGATDPTDETGKLLNALEVVRIPGVDVVVGEGNPRRNEIASRCSALRGVRCHIQTARMAELMRRADLAVGAGGATTWERCLLGLPTLTVVTADNQIATAQDLSEAGVIWYLGRAEALRTADYQAALAEATRDSERLRKLSRRAEALMAPALTALASGHHALVDTMLGATLRS